MGNFFVVYLILIISVYFCDSANILGIFYVPSYSHCHLTSTLMKELARRGHNVTAINTFPQRTPIKNVRDIPLTHFTKWFEKSKDEIYKSHLLNANFMTIEAEFQQITLHGTEMVLNETPVQALLKSNEKFDLIMIEEYGNYALKGFAYHFNAPCIIFVASKATRWVNPPIGNPMFPSYIQSLGFKTHPNIKLIITHGGLLSTHEAIYHGVPVVGVPVASDQKLNMVNAVDRGLGLSVPVASDQKLNMVNAVDRGLGLSVPFHEITESKLLSAIEEVLIDSKYKENAKRLSKIFHDQPMKPLDKAMFWIEYVIRHQGAPHLRVASLNLSWYQYLLLDVIAFVLIVILALGLITYMLIRRFVFRKKPLQKTLEKMKAN